MGLFKKKRSNSSAAGSQNSAELAQRALDFITEAVLVVDSTGMIQFANPAAARMTGYDSPDSITGLDYRLVFQLADSEGVPVLPEQSDVYIALATNQPLTTRKYMLISVQTEKRIAVAISCIPTGGTNDFRIITARDITVELAEEREQAEFISTASHEMRTPVASIEGYLGLALNPQTATIDARAQQYLSAAHLASQHLGHLFKDLLDVTKIDDQRVKTRLVPVDAVEIVKQLAEEHLQEMQAKKLKYSFGTNEPSIDKKRIEPKVYMAVDLDFLKEIMNNLISNAIKYTPEGGEIWVNARGDGDKVLINVSDTGIGISADDASHVFQKFYRVDNSQTRQIGGTGLGLYLVKQRAEALGGRVWLESSFGDGSTFFVSLPRISDSEYEKMLIAYQNEQMVGQFQQAAQARSAALQAAPNLPAAQPASPASAQPQATSSQPQPSVASQISAAQPVSPVSAQPQATSSQPQPSVAPQTSAAQSIVSPPVSQINQKEN